MIKKAQMERLTSYQKVRDSQDKKPTAVARYTVAMKRKYCCDLIKSRKMYVP